MKDKIECVLAVMLVGTVCYLSIIGKIEAAAIIGLAMYALKKTLDGIQNEKKENKDV